VSELYDSISEQPISLFRPQSVNANKHSQRGEGMLEASLSQVGWMGAITVAADNQVFDGSLRLEKFAIQFDGINPIVLDVDGTRPVILRRTDIPTADDPKAIQASVWANRVSEASLSWDTDVLTTWQDEGSISLDWFWEPQEQSKLGLPDDEQDKGERGTKEIQCVCPNCGCEFTKI
jgi:hypothetical protein